MKRHLLSALTLALLATATGVTGYASAADAAKSPAAGKLTSGIAVEYIDPSVRAQDDTHAPRSSLPACASAPRL